MKKITLPIKLNKAVILAIIFFVVSCVFGYRLYISGESVYSEQMGRKFYMIEKSLSNSNEVLAHRNKQLLGFLRKATDREPAKAQPFLDASIIIDQAANQITDIIKDLKCNLRGRIYENIQEYTIENSGKSTNTELKNLFRELYSDSFHTKIKNYIALLKEKCIHFKIESSYIQSLEKIFKQYENDSQSSDWTTKNFDHISLEQLSLLLAKFENDIRYMAEETMHNIAQRVSINDWGWGSRIRAIVIPKCDMVAVGEKYEASIGLAYMDFNRDTYADEIILNGKSTKINKGIGKIEEIAKEGKHTYKGEIRMRDVMFGEIQTYEFEGEYIGYKLPPNVKR